MHLDLGIRVKLASILSDHWRLLCPMGSVTSFHSARALLSIYSQNQIELEAMSRPLGLATTVALASLPTGQLGIHQFVGGKTELSSFLISRFADTSSRVL